MTSGSLSLPFTSASSICEVGSVDSFPTDCAAVRGRLRVCFFSGFGTVFPLTTEASGDSVELGTGVV